MDAEKLKRFVLTVVDLYRDNFIQLLNNPEFHENNLIQQERTVQYVTELFKQELQENIDSFVKASRG